MRVYIFFLALTALALGSSTTTYKTPHPPSDL